jgi:hypothetical protein
MSNYLTRELSTLTLSELEDFMALVEHEINNRNLTYKVTKRVHIAYEVYLNAARRMGPKAKTLELNDWTFDYFVDYISRRFPDENLIQIPVGEILEEEATNRTEEWVKARKESRPPNYISLTHPFRTSY